MTIFQLTGNASWITGDKTASIPESCIRRNNDPSTNCYSLRNPVKKIDVNNAYTYPLTIGYKNVASYLTDPIAVL